MPANPKYLSSTKERILKITAAILGGYLLSMAIHLIIGMSLSIEQQPIMVATTAFSAFSLWAVFMVIAFIAKSGKKIWAIYGSLIVFLSLIISWLKYF
ncbi:hypothetical protein Fleli_3489 [Bernardetia litoralis DSM 6794]|uniref:DUF3649 domain-containing protein n=1 Tax=Bernardetia litoralis (strain ATCC 23117 / DSM 6794 / NBRC 15988 / NCIMB 1366 / Fx l1 / Sio-4) TaxID=880071 RepID=I4APC4_BERLS|nr:hypothetical protein [Bernardetia litoralis]AFM05809.1 hypothetical protein Fleli_3489 [Bernardetia litoralis DSM 6794]